MQLGDQRHDEADEGQCLDECGAQDEHRKQAPLDLRLTRHRRGCAVGSKTDTDAGADNTETITNDSHDSSFVTRLDPGEL